jgi:hypothetical protein
MAGRNSTTERINWARDQLLRMRSSTDVVAELTQRWGCSRRTSQRIVSRAHALFLEDLAEAGVNRTVLAAQLEHGLLTAFSMALRQNHPAAATGVARELRKLLHLQAAPSPLPRDEPWRF